MFVSSAARLCLGLGLFPQPSATTPTGVGPFGGDEVDVEPQQPPNSNIQVQVEPQKRGKGPLAQWAGMSKRGGQARHRALMGSMLTILRSADKRGAFLRTAANEHLHHPWATIHPFGGTSPAKRTPHPALHHLRLGMEVDVGFQSVPCSGWRTYISGNQPRLFLQHRQHWCVLRSQETSQPIETGMQSPMDGIVDRIDPLSHPIVWTGGGDGKVMFQGVEFEVVLAPCRAEKATKLHSSQTGAP